MLMVADCCYLAPPPSLPLSLAADIKNHDEELPVLGLLLPLGCLPAMRGLRRRWRRSLHLLR